MSRSLIILPVLLILLFCSDTTIAQNRQVFQKLDSIIAENEFNYRTHHLTLRPGITWLSFPRLAQRDANGNCHYQSVFEDLDNILPSGNLTYLELENLPPEWVDEVYLTWDYNANWGDEDLSTINSTLGYKLDLTPEMERDLIIKGSLPEPGTAEADIHLYAGYKNWVGYFAHQTQQVFDLIPDNVLDDIIEIKHQDWAVYNTQLPGPPAPDGTCPGGWKCGENVQLLVRYGDMLIIRTNTDHVFQWLPYTRSEQDQSQEAGYFTYEEEPDYTAVFIELDTTNNPLEIGAFVNDSCIGAASVGQDDSLVQLRAYTDTANMGDLVFEEYYGLKSTPQKITEYLVEDLRSGKMVKRKIHTGEKQAYYSVSFRKGKKNNNQLENQQMPILQCLPNPVKDYCSINYTLHRPGSVRLKVFDLFGRSRQVIYEGDSPAGSFSMQWAPKENRNNPLSTGIYIIQLQTPDARVQHKVMISR